MPINSQFLFFYIDEFIKNQWIDWSERVLSEAPAEEFHVQRGFQQVAGADNSSVRTRALEAFRLGMINSRLVNERAGERSSLPEGWRRVCGGLRIHTRLGYFAYVIGKAIGIDSSLDNVINPITTIQILLIGFKYNDRWYSTVNIFDFVCREYESHLNRKLNEVELRYLAGAVFNTLDGDHCGELISAYSGNSILSSLFYKIRSDASTITDDDEGEQASESNFIELEINPENFLTIITDFNINSIVRHKAALFWANQDRGFYSRALSGNGRDFLSKFMEIDRIRASANDPSMLHGVFEGIQHGQQTLDLIDVISGFCTVYPDLLDEWENVMGQLQFGVVKAIECLDIAEGHTFLSVALQGIRQTLEEDYDTPESSENLAIDITDTAIQKLVRPERRRSRSPRPELSLSSEEIITLVSERLDTIFSDPPRPSERVRQDNDIGRTRVIRKFDQAERDQRNRNLGMAGEELVMAIERGRLISLGHADLAEKVSWVSKDLGDGAGYDIISYDGNREAIFIEVKATRGGPSTQFYVSENELQVSREKNQTYRLYRVYNLGANPQVYILVGALDNVLELKPISYRAKPLG